MAAATLLPVRNPRTGECDYDMPIVPAAEIAPIVEALACGAIQLVLPWARLL